MSHENDPLLPHPQFTRPRSRFFKYLQREVSPRRSHLILIFCYIITGLLDSSALFIWGSYVSIQTGNTIYLGLGLARADPSERCFQSALSIASFGAGCWFFNGFYNSWTSARQRWVLCSSFTIQMIIVAIAAAIVTEHHPHWVPEDWHVLVPLCLLAFQSGGQVVTSRVLEYRGLTSVVLTSIYCDMFSNPLQFPPQQRQRAGAVVCLILGTIMGGAWANSATGLPGSLWTAVALKGLAAGTWLVWPAMEEH